MRAPGPILFLRRWLALAAFLLAGAVLSGCGLLPGLEAAGRPGAADPAAVTAPHITAIVQEGDTVHAIARRHRVQLRAVIEANGLRPPYRLAAGQRLRLPAPAGYVVRRGDTLLGIARRFDLSIRALVRLNGIPPPYRIRAGEVLRLPAGTPAAASSPAAGRPSQPPVLPLARPERRPPGQPASAALAASALPRPAGVDPALLQRPPPRAGTRFQWPVRGRVIAGFGPREGGLHNDGINIAAARGTEVVAAENGIVAYVGNELRGFGNLLLIKHAGGWMTAYAHAERLLVRPGQRVRRGQPVATIGATGGVGRPQLHFEIRKGARAVDPRRLMEG